MKRDNPLKHAGIAFAIAIACYVLFYWGIEHQRRKKGPWQVTFTSASNGAPSLIIDQPSSGITNVQITFPEDAPPTNTTSRLTFADPKPVPYDVPFGTCVFMDTTFLPGTLTFRLLGHEIELLPRVLVIDHREHSWVPHDQIILNKAIPPEGPGPAGQSNSAGVSK